MKRDAEDEDDISIPGNPERQRVLNDLGLMSEAELCLVYQCGRKALQNRSSSELPPYFKAGGKRLFFKADVVKFFRQRTNGGD